MNSAQPARSGQVTEIQERGALLCMNHVHDIPAPSAPPEQYAFNGDDLRAQFSNNQYPFI